MPDINEAALLGLVRYYAMELADSVEWRKRQHIREKLLVEIARDLRSLSTAPELDVVVSQIKALAPEYVKEAA